MKRILFITLLFIIAISGQLYAIESTTESTIERSFENITKTISLLDKISDHAYIIADTSDKNIGQAAKKKLQNLMKKLDVNIYNELFDDYNVIITHYPHDHIIVVDASKRLIDKIQSIKADAAVRLLKQLRMLL